MSSNIALVRCVVAELNPEKRFVTSFDFLAPHLDSPSLV
jgi:hypothetical protein